VAAAMKARPRIVIVGAGGLVFPVELARDILSFRSLGDGTIVLYDIDVPAAERTAGVVRELARTGGRAAAVEAAARVRGAQPGPDHGPAADRTGGHDR